MDSVISDFLFAFRVFFKRPGLTLLAIAALSLSLGMSITAFSILNGMFLKPLPFEKPEELHDISMVNTEYGFRKVPIPLEHYEDLTNLKSFKQTMGYLAGTINISGKGMPQRYNGCFVTTEFPDVLGIQPVLGSTFTRGTGQEIQRELVISHDVWQEQFLGDPEVIGTIVRANGKQHRIAGVMPEGFKFRNNVDVWMPIDTSPDAAHAQHITHLYAIGRVFPTVSISEIQKELGETFSSWTNVTLEEKKGTELTCTPFGKVELSQADNYAFVAALGALIFVLLVSCANVANLLVGRALSRGREMAIRSAIGASRKRIIRQLLTESLLLAFFGSVGGLILAAWQVDSTVSTGIFEKPYWMNFELDWRVFGFAFVIMLSTALVSGLIPAWQSSKINLNEMLKDTSHTSTSFKLGRLTRMLAVVQIAFSCALLFGAGLIARNVYKMANIDTGYDGKQYLTMRMGLFPADYPKEEDKDAFFNELATKVRKLPEVEEAAVTSWIAEYGNIPKSYLIAHDSVENPRFEHAYSESVSSSFFSAYDLQPIAGSLFHDQETVDGNIPVVINKAFADNYLQGIDPVGLELGYFPEKEANMSEPADFYKVVGVVPNIRVTEFTKPEKPEPIVYIPYTSTESAFMSLVVRSSQEDKQTLKTAVQKVILDLDPNLPVYFTKTMDKFVEQRIYPFRMMANFFLFVGLMALFLAAIGVYGMLAFNVSRRRREIGIRMALGASTLGIVSQILRQGFFQLGLGLIIGTGLAYIVGQLTSRFLLGINPTDPSVYIGVLLTLFGVATLSFFIPARRAASLSPLEALRYE